MNFIVITTIFEPTEAVRLFSQQENCRLIVVGDRKTPINWNCPGVDYLSVQTQCEAGFQTAKQLPYNHYSRKMLGYLAAMKAGAECIVDTDDDNIPKDSWNIPSFEGAFNFITQGKGFINVYQLYTDQKIWPRGLPLNLVTINFELHNFIQQKDATIGIWQGLADDDPDVDAVYRLTDNSPCWFREEPPYVLGAGTISPFNSQNTIIRKELFALLYLPTSVTFRFTDILRGLVAQPIMWLYHYTLGFTGASVVQKRNPHDYMQDFISEIPMYQHAEKIVDIVSKEISASLSVEDNLLLAYRGLLRHSIVTKEEIATLGAWLQDIRSMK